MQAHHVTISLASRAVLARDTAAQRAAARTILTVSRPFRLLAVRVADNHGHFLVAEGRAEAGECARRLEIGLFTRLDLDERWEPARVRPIADQRHLENAFTYLVRQDAHHGYGHDPAHEASNLPDLLGWRVLGAWTRDHVRAWMPRRRLDTLADLAGLPNGVADGPLDLLADAAAAAIGVAELTGQSRDVVRARTAACHVADATTRELMDALQAPSRTIERARSRTPEPEIVEAIRRQLFLRDALRARDPAPPSTDLSAVDAPDWTSSPADDRPWP